MTMNLSIVARVLLGSRDIFVQVRKILPRPHDFLLQARSVMKNIIVGNWRSSAEYRD